ncbi:ATP-binding protein [Flagellatimonas centrodinii]|uniref:ATP-binding protein n=1 Tax=Flagellatimonas centrodinii TaxID=2806210 RepID=UPI001FEE615A|nr:ATP-binding protein [Flagellatimonas centrodinii]ULQ45802.1 ATP-binding protein [Flagellatimonas centrodinii]
MTSLRTRLLLAASLVLAGFVFACAAALDHAFEERALSTQRDRLQGLVYALLSAAEPTADGALGLSPFRLPDARLQNPGSGLEAALLDERNALTWGSVSLSDDFPLPGEVAPGAFEFTPDPLRFSLSFGLRWLNPIEGEQRYTLLVMEDRTAFDQQMRAYRRTLWGWLAVAAVALLSVQGTILAWGLVPLRQLRSELSRVEQGGQGQIDGEYPAELTPLTDAINGMIRSGQAQVARQRNALDDLAHSLKTPLAALRALSEDPRLAPGDRSAIDEPVNRMLDIVDHQLRRAVTAGSRSLAGAVDLLDILERLSRTLRKVYTERQPRFQWVVPRGFKVRMDSGDLYELLGNLLDNAVKYGHGQVRVSARRQGRELLLSIEDDGPGFPEAPERLLARGVRADTRTPGQGIGLAASHELVQAYHGQLQLARSTHLGGARVHVRLPV